MICIECITADNSSSSANKLALMSGGREQCPVYMCGSFTQSLQTLFETSSILSRQQIRLRSVHLHTQLTVWRSFVGALFSAELLLLSFTFWQAGSQVYNLLSFLLHVSILVTAGLPCPNSTLFATVCREGKEGEGTEVKTKEQVGTFFRGPVIFYLISQELLDCKSKVCRKKREDNKTQTGALHSIRYQEKSHPRAKPATFLGPLTLFRVSVCLCGRCCGIYKWSRDGNVLHVRLWRLSFSNTMSSGRIWQVELQRQHIEVN